VRPRGGKGGGEDGILLDGGSCARVRTLIM